MVGLLLKITGVLGVLCGLLMLLTRFRNPPIKDATFQSTIQKLLYADLNKPHHIDKQIYRHHRVIGLIMIFVASLWLWLLLQQPALHKFLTLTYQYLKAIVQSELLAIVTAALLAISVLLGGVIMLIRPSLLKPYEAIAHRKLMTHTKREYAPQNLIFFGLPKIQQNVAGLLLLAAGIVCLYSATLL